MNIGVHRVPADVQEDYMDLDMLDDLSYGKDILYALMDIPSQTICIRDLNAKEICRIHDDSDGRPEEVLLLKLFQFAPPGSSFLFGRTKDLSADKDCFVFLYLQGIRKGFHFFFRNIPYMNSDNFSSLDPGQTEKILRKFLLFPEDSGTDSRVTRSWTQILQTDPKFKKN